jgi:hypothetical protein
MGSGDLPRRCSTVVRLFGRSAALAAAAGAALRRSAHSRIAKRSRKRNAKSHSCSRRRPIGQHASRSGKLAARIHSRIQLPAHSRSLDMALAAFGMWSANRFCDYYQAARSSPSVLRCGPPARANRSARIGCARQYESIASRGVGGVNGRLRARASTAGGKIAGIDLESRANDLRFRSAFSVCQSDMRLRPPTRIMAPRGKTLVHDPFDLILFVKRLLYEQCACGAHHRR